MCSRWQIAVAVILNSTFVWLSGARVLLHDSLTKKVDNSVRVRSEAPPNRLASIIHTFLCLLRDLVEDLLRFQASHQIRTLD